MARRELLRWEEQLGRALRPCRPGAVKPYLITVQQDVPKEVFSLLLKLATTNMYCTQLRETRSIITLKVTHVNKLVSVFSRVNTCEKNYYDREDILCRKSRKEVFKAVVSEKKHFVLKFYKSCERVTITMFYRHWNSFGFPQHCWFRLIIGHEWNKYAEPGSFIQNIPTAIISISHL